MPAANPPLPAAVDVVIVGAGATGMALANLLGEEGIRTIVLERHDGIYPLPRAVHLDDEVYRILHEIGVGEQFSQISHAGLGLRLVDRRHRVLAQFERSPTAKALPQANMFDQPDLERVLLNRLASHPTVTVEYGRDVTSVRGAADSVTVHARDTRSGATHAYTAAFVVGCDGANSTVKTAVGGVDVDLGFDQRWLVVDLCSETPLDGWDGVHQVCDSQRAGTYMRVGPKRHRWEFQLLPHEKAADYQGIAALRPLIDPWARAVPTTDLRLLRSVEYTFRARVADRWRSGRCFLAGDAAHLTPPFIGQGLGAGLRDAANLAWKIAVALRNSNAQVVLDSYESERKPHATAMVKRAVMIGRAMSGGGRAATLMRRIWLPMLSKLPALGTLVLSSTTPPLVAGQLVTADARRWRGTLLPLEVVPGPDGPTLIDRRLGRGLSLIALAGLETAHLAEPWAKSVVRVDARSDDPGERALGRWLEAAGARCALIRPDRVVVGLAANAEKLSMQPVVRKLTEARGEHAVAVPTVIECGQGGSPDPRIHRSRNRCGQRRKNANAVRADG
jgi:3-(3-hydroxy-phenyl)propionate hydroxylase